MKRVLIPIAALASIATSQLPDWSLVNDHEVTPVTLNDGATEVRYLIHTELVGPGPFEGVSGWVEVNIFENPTPSNPVTVELRSLTRPDMIDTGPGLPLGTVNGEAIYLDTWFECSTSPCVEDFELIIRRTTAEPVEITGMITTNTEGDDPDLPAGTEVKMTVMGPL